MSQAVKLGPLWNRVTFDSGARVVKLRGKTLARYDDILALRVVELIGDHEEQQLLNVHPDVQKAPRSAELWLDLKDGRKLRTAELEQVGLLLEAVAPTGLPVTTERKLL
jgi:hypothetical protein